ncbi:receptor-like protein 19 [Rhododendron vialii]|uniref:receptor-like protein 19 n=1 Tax=Rhododendron vialii TaxID=182163 RepID=UPI0026603320|nr:receptor-like protein 19 [Rhododendron vialii]
MGALPWLFLFLLCFSQHLLAFSSSSLPSFSSSSSARPLCHRDQRSALLQFKHMFTINSNASQGCERWAGIPSYPKTLTWDENATDCCNWDGVTCDRLTGHVVGLDLSCSQLYGKIHPNSSLSQLSHLQQLNLAFNDFNDSRISYAFGSFAKLTHLNLSYSALSGSIPSEISHMSKLISLDLSYSQLRLELLHFEILLKNLTQLQELDLFEVNISSDLPDSIGYLKSLKSLDLTWTGLSGKLPDSIGYLKSLNYLFVGDCKLRGSIPKSLGNLTQICELYLWGNSFTGEVSSTLSNLKQLTALDLSANNFQGRIPVLAELTNLEYLYLDDNNFTGGFPIWVANLKPLVALSIHSNQLTGPIPFNLSGLQNLQFLYLSSNQLTVPIPFNLSGLQNLQVLHLSGNQLTGPIPFNLSGLQNLRELYLNDNSLSGVIPPSLFTLASLEVLDLHSNKLTGQIPEFQHHLPLEFIDLSDNKLRSPIPQSISTLVNLTSLFLDHNSFSEVIPPSLFTLPSLRYLYLSSNNLTGQIPEFQHHLPLDTIDLSDNKLRGPIPQSISTLVNLTVLSLASNDLSGVDLHILKNVESLDISNTNISVVTRSNVNNTLPNLRYFYMSSCNIEVFPYFLRALENLEVLDLSQNKIHGQIPNWAGFIGKASLRYLNLSNNFLTDIKQLPWEKLATLDLRSNLLQGPLPVPPPLIGYFFISNNTLSGEIPSLICNASTLEILDLSHNKLSGAVPQCLGNFSSVLSVLNLRSNGFTGTLPLAFVKPSQLQSLDLSGNKFEGPLPRSLKNCTWLEVLNVGSNKINDTFPNWLGTLHWLQVLVVRSNRFHGHIHTTMSEFSFPKLRIVDLSYNEFTGHLPTRYFENFQAMKSTTMSGEQYMSVGGSSYHDSLIVTMKGLEVELVRILTIFTTIDFSSNNFSGEIPNVVGKLNSLILLNFSHNSLTGHIPASLGNLTNLESLDISFNQLMGKIPSQLTSLTFLAVLNLSWNRLHGPIPGGKQFATFENGSYAGNLGLCGFPLSKECEDNRTKVQPPVLQHEEDDSDFDGFTWKIVVIGYGCGMTLGLFLGSLMFLIGRPRFFVKLAERKLPKKVIRLSRTVADTVNRRK